MRNELNKKLLSACINQLRDNKEIEKLEIVN